MALTTKQIVFFFFFSLQWLLLLLLGESYLGYVLLGLGTLFLILFSGDLDWQQLPRYRVISFLWLFFLLGLILSFIFTSSLPLSLFSLGRMIFASLSFWFFLLLKKKTLSKSRLIKSVVLVSVVISILSVLMQLSPTWGKFLPGMNILYATYGHNHVAALILLVMPLSWWLASKEKGQKRLLFWVLSLFLSLVLLLSFGRLAIFIGLIQFLIIYKYLSARISKKETLFFKVISIFFSLVLLIKVFLSISFLISPEFNCSVPGEWKSQICKPLSTEFRPHYWLWALKITRDNSFVGSGPGTFGIAASKYHLDLFKAAADAHNAFLAAFSEMGILGGVGFFLLMFGLLFKSWTNHSSSDWNLSTALLLAVGSIFIDVLFDFDWSFVGIFSLTLVYLAILNRQDKRTPQIQLQSFYLHKLSYWLGCLFLIILTTFYLVTETLIRSNKIVQAFDLFPYFHWHRKIFEKEFVKDQVRKDKLLEIYKNHPTIYEFFYPKETNQSRKQILLENWIKVDPWKLTNKDATSFYLETENWPKLEEKIVLVADFWEWAEENSDFHVPYSDKTKLASQMWALADAYLQQGETKSAAEWYFQAYSVNEWILSDHDQPDLDSVSSSSKKLDFFDIFSQIAVEHYSGLNGIYAFEYEQALVDYLENEFETQIITPHLNNIFRISDTRKLQLWKNLAPIFANEINQDLEEGGMVAAQEKSTVLLEVWKILSNNGEDYLDFATYDLENSLLQIIKLKVSENEYQDQFSFLEFPQFFYDGNQFNHGRYLQILRVIRVE